MQENRDAREQGGWVWGPRPRRQILSWGRGPVTVLRAGENCPDPPGSPQLAMCYRVFVFFLQKVRGHWGKAQSPAFAGWQSGAGSHRVCVWTPSIPLWSLQPRSQCCPGIGGRRGSWERG